MQPRSRPARSDHVALAAAAALVVAASVAFAACTGPAPTQTTPAPTVPRATASASLLPVDSPTPVPGPTATPGPTLPGQTDTAWGRIWDALPPAFPAFAGSRPTDTGAGPASGMFDVAGAAGDIASFYRTALEGAGFTTVSYDGPLDDGGWVVGSSGANGCALQVSIVPLGGSTTVTILYGAACPFVLP